MKTKKKVADDLWHQYFNRLISAEEMLNQAYNAGFESCKEKVEEGVKNRLEKAKTPDGYLPTGLGIGVVLETIKEMKP